MLLLHRKIEEKEREERLKGKLGLQSEERESTIIILCTASKERKGLGQGNVLRFILSFARN